MKKPTKKQQTPKPTQQEVREALNTLYASTMLEKEAQEFAVNHPGAEVHIHADVLMEVIGCEDCAAVREYDGYVLKAAGR